MTAVSHCSASSFRLVRLMRGVRCVNGLTGGGLNCGERVWMSGEWSVVEYGGSCCLVLSIVSSGNIRVWSSVADLP